MSAFDELRNAAPGTVLAVDLEESFWWSDSVPNDDERRARALEVADEAARNLSDNGIVVEVLGTGSYVDRSTMFWSATVVYSYVVKVLEYVPERFPPTIAGTVVASAVFVSGLPFNVLTGQVAESWDANLSISRMTTVELVEGAADALETVGETIEGATSFARIALPSLAVLAVVGAALIYLPKPAR